METAIIQVSGSVELSFDRNSSEFKNALASYRDHIDSFATENDMLCAIAKSVALNGINKCIEGVGFVGYTFRYPNAIPENGYCGVMVVESGYDDFECEITS